MRNTVVAVLVLSLGACGQPQTQEAAAPPAAQAAEAPPTSTDAASASVEGWDIDPEAFAGIGTVVPELPGDQITRDALRDRWTILGFGDVSEAAGEEATFIAALASAVNQDPDLDFIPINGDQADAVAAALGVTQFPQYLLVGPDLTIEAARGALSDTPDDGIKSVIRGVAEIRKQVSAPH